ncbi:competence protein ComEA [Prauserella alba]|uniref:Helix-hairpin-helix DNA-binding motif class 1 domain-containing protein n=2 Tax=Prauserella alba TaxID=176898 RepID=A0ABP4FZK5_9PSEU|nr:competence protein ComEA [Prauserella alba]
MAPLDEDLGTPPVAGAADRRPADDPRTGRSGAAFGHVPDALPETGRSGSGGDDSPAPPDETPERPDPATGRDPGAMWPDGAAASGCAAPRSAVGETGPPDEPGGPRNVNSVPAALRGRAGRLVERWVPAGLAGTGRRPSRRVLVAVAAGVVIALGLAGFVLADEPAAETPPPLPAANEVSASEASRPGPATPSSAAPSTSGLPASPGAQGGRPERLVVSVVGKVRRPGLVRLRPGARVADAIESAGGAPRRADLLSVNLARELGDGEQIYVGVPVPPGVRTGAAGGGDASATGGETGDQPVPLNSADREALESLPGVGEVTAQRILEWRDEHGGFTAVEQLREVDGIGEKRFAELRDAVSIA